ncbi:hypothetical protein KFE25_006082 [Diacronema lutheri]|uniref:EF-hand domain-containing protein n=2 Tax=Diacronema lutheri TaxID=2081491 RepID=A0A8J6CC86_DIALT|nr:hypothetical protein KFE25_006082 [Diacronema lutheri]
MASKYKAEFDLPKEFPSILKAFTREILRYQPENVYEFGASYFQNLLKEHAAADSGGSKRRLSPQELEQLLRQLFAEHDVDGNGHLDHKEFRALLNSANLGLSPREVKRVLAEADENEDGRIEYTEFIPVAIELVQAMYAKMDLVAEKQEQANAARQAAEAHMLHGMPREALEAIMSDIFRKADLDGSGTLSRKEFNTCLREADLGLKRKEINLIMAEVDTDEDGTITYAEFVPLCYQILVEILKDEMVAAQQTPTQLEELLLDLMSSSDAAETGLLPAATVKDLIRSADFGLTRLQIHTVLAEADEDGDGRVQYVAFAPIAADLIYRLLDPEAQASKMESVRALTSPGGASTLVHNLDEAAMGEVLTALFEQADVSQSSSLPKSTVKRLLVDSEIGFSPKEVQCLISTADVDVDGAIMYHSLALEAHRQLAYLELQSSS